MGCIVKKPQRGCSKTFSQIYPTGNHLRSNPDKAAKDAHEKYASMRKAKNSGTK